MMPQTLVAERPANGARHVNFDIDTKGSSFYGFSGLDGLPIRRHDSYIRVEDPTRMSMAQTETQRVDERVRTHLHVSYGVGSLECTSVAESISPGGVYINTNDVYKVGTRLVLQIEFADRSVCLRGEVTWAIRVPENLKDKMVCGMGVAFVDPDPRWPEFFLRWKEGMGQTPR